MELRRRFGVSILALLLATPLLADARDDYKAGLEALSAGNLARARELLQRAIDSDSQAKKPVIGRDYLPHFYLGKALFALDDCRGALEAWAESERQGAVKKAKEEMAELGPMKSTCRERIREFDAAVQGSQSEIDRATEAATRVGLLETDEVVGEFWEEGDPSLKTRQFEALRLLWEARKQLQEAQDQNDASKIEGARELSLEAIAALGALEKVAEQMRREALARRQNLQQRLERSLASAEAVLGATEGPAESAPGVASLRTRLRKLVSDGRKPSERSASELRSLSNRLESLSSGLRRATTVPPEELQIAAASYLSGDYDTVLALLEAFTSEDERIVAQCCLLRSASYHALERLRLPLPPLPPPPILESELEPDAAEADDREPESGESDELEPMGSGPEEVASGDPVPIQEETISPAVQVLLDCPPFEATEPTVGRFLPPSYQAVLDEYRRLVSESREEPADAG